MSRRATKPIPEGLRSITPQLWFDGNCREAVDFYKRVFGAELVGELDTMPDGKVMHAGLRIGNSTIFLADTMGSEYTKGPGRFTTASLYLYVKDSDAVFEKAKRSGCEVLMTIQDVFWGDRSGEVRDPYGHVWDIATNKRILSREEMKTAEEKWLIQQHSPIV
jgi:uncharacterized glyoxalase superfamily protein PhnB